MVSKYFRSGDISEVIQTCKKHFKKVTSFKPKSSRKESSEIYLICLEKKSAID
jgi:23S rRNA (uridine2552-2'-O)-methyltransferase